MRHDDKCSHGKTYEEACIECEKIGLINKLEWMKPMVIDAEKRLDEINGVDGGKRKYTVERNLCNCHPETCCCDDWAVLTPDGDKWDTFFHKDKAEKTAEMLNKGG
jgi:hypothetical protein